MRLALVFAILASPALAQGTTIVSPVYDQLVAIPVPTGFAAGFEREQGGAYILELVPPGERVEDWTQLITVTGSRGSADKLSVTDMASTLADGYQAACPGSFTAHKLAPPKVQGARAVFAGYLGCGSVGGHAEAMVFVVLQGKSDLYTLQWAEHGPAVDHPVEPDAAIWRLRADSLGLARLCDKVAGEQPPYPSCTD